MKIIRNAQKDTYTLGPVEEGEADILAAFSGALKRGERIVYGGYCFESPLEWFGESLITVEYQDFQPKNLPG